MTNVQMKLRGNKKLKKKPENPISIYQNSKHLKQSEDEKWIALSQCRWNGSTQTWNSKQEELSAGDVQKWP